MVGERDMDILEEASLIGAQGAGITGGDPLCRLDRTIRYIKLLKKGFGRLSTYTCTRPGQRPRRRPWKAVQAGLDEIRFHPDFMKGGEAELRAG